MKKLVLFPLAIMLVANLSDLQAQGTAFTYQGRLESSGAPANGSYDFQFIVYDNNPGGNEQGPVLTNAATAVSNGLFIVTLDFGQVFPGTNRWLDIAVRTNGGSLFVELVPRQPLTPTPYAITAATAITAITAGGVTPGAGLAGTYGGAVTFSNAANSIAGTFTGNGANVTNVNASALGGLSKSNFWQLGANNVAGGQVLGSANNQPLQFVVNNQTAMRFAYASNAVDGFSPNVIGGESGNYVSSGVVGATIGGGGLGVFANSVQADFGTVLGGAVNMASGQFSVAGGGISTASGAYSIAMGSNAVAGGDMCIALGNSTANGQFATALGGSESDAYYSTALGGSYATGNFSVALGESEADGRFAVAMGSYTVASGYCSFSAGNNAHALHDGSFVWADNISDFDEFDSTSSNQFLIRADGGVGINTDSPHADMLTVGTATGAYGMEQTDGNIRVGTYVGGSTGGGWMGTISNHKFSLYVNSGPPTLTLNTNGLVGIGTTTPSTALQVIGTVTATTFNTSSDRNLKENFTPVSAREVLDKVTALPISRWNFKQDATAPHLGPMAQDFYAAFALGTDDKHIATVDEGGVALAAIQGLNQKLNEKDAEIQNLRRQNDSLAGRLNGLEEAVKLLAAHR